MKQAEISGHRKMSDAIHTRLSLATLEALDKMAMGESRTRAAMMRVIIEWGLKYNQLKDK